MNCPWGWCGNFEEVYLSLLLSWLWLQGSPWARGRGGPVFHALAQPTWSGHVSPCSLQLQLPLAQACAWQWSRDPASPSDWSALRSGDQLFWGPYFQSHGWPLTQVEFDYSVVKPPITTLPPTLFKRSWSRGEFHSGWIRSSLCSRCYWSSSLAS